MRRHQDNPNLFLHSEPSWNGIPVQTQCGALVSNYLERIRDVIGQALSDHPRIAVFRFELMFPCFWPGADSAVITRFTESLKAKIESLQARKSREGKRVHPTRVRFVWVKEKSSAMSWHYHFALILNKDSFHSLGEYCESPGEAWIDVPRDPRAGQCNCLAHCIVQAWASAVGATPEQVIGSVHFSRNGVYFLNVNSPDYVQQYANLFYRLSYMAKAETKCYGDSRNAFGCSRG